MSNASANGSETKKRRKKKGIQDEFAKSDFFTQLQVFPVPDSEYSEQKHSSAQGWGEEKGSSAANSNYLSGSRWEKQEEVLQDESRLGFAQVKTVLSKSTKTPQTQRCCQQVLGIVATSHPASHTPRLRGKWEPAEPGKHQVRALSCSPVSLGHRIAGKAGMPPKNRD